MRGQRFGVGIVLGKGVQMEEGVIVWNYVVIGDNVKIGRNTRIGSFCDIGRDVIIGEGCIIQAHVTISNGCKIGNNVFIGPNSSLLNDKYPPSECLTPPTIEDEAIIGGSATILPNVVVGREAVVAAGSLVTKDVPPRAVVMGAPARVVMTRSEYEAKKEEFVRLKGKIDVEVKIQG